MKKSGFKLLVCLLIAALLCGCDSGLFDPEYAITAPTDGAYQGVYEAVQKSVGKDIVLKYPAVQGVHTAYYPWDCNGDGVHEVLVFYQLRSKGGATGVQMVKQVEGEWQSVQELDAVGTDVLHADLCDLDGDGVSELCIGWSVATTNAHVMSVYQVENGVLLQRAKEEYTNYVVCDINNDKIQDLGLAVLSTETKTSNLRFYTLKKGTFSQLGSIGLDGNVMSYGKITAAGITAQNTGVYLDVYKGTDSMITELVYFKGGKLYNPFAAGMEAINTATLRYCTLQSGDINHDGAIEIPFMVPLPGYTGTVEEDRDMTHYLIHWRYYNGNLSDTVATWFYNPTDGYYLELDSIWEGEFTVTYHSDVNAHVFYSWKDGKAGSPLLTLRSFAPADFESSGEGYEKLWENETAVWAVKVENTLQSHLDISTLKQRFHMIVA